MTTTFNVGDTVTVSGGKFPGVWTVTKLNPVNINLVQNGRRLKAHPSYLTKTDGTAPVEAVDIPDPLDIGAVVTLQGKSGFFVVIKESADRVNVVQLGGDGGRYWRTTRSGVTKVDGTFIPSV